MSNIDLGDTPIGTPPTLAEQQQIRLAIGAASAIQTVTTSPFNAVVMGRYIAESGGTLQINDPTTRANGSALVAGDSYEIWIGSGGIQFNGTGTVFQPSRFSIRRRWNGSAWTSPLPVLSDPLSVGAGQWTGSVFSGAQSFSGQVELTNQTAANPTSAINRTLGDTRYGNMIVSRRAADAAPIQSQTTLQSTGCSVALPVGVWEIHAQTHVTNANAAAQVKFGGTVSGGTFNTVYGRIMWGIANTGVPGHDNQDWLTATRTLGNATRGWASYDGVVEVTAGMTTITTQYAQNVSTAADTIVRSNTFIVARRIG